MDSNATGTTGGGSRGGVSDAGQTQAWPRYEAEYLKRALQSSSLKYDASGLDSQQRQTYLDKVTSSYKEEADECLKAEFEQWLQGKHEVNDPSKEHIYENADGKPVRRWVLRTDEAEDAAGQTKVGQARAGWKHTPWGRSSLTNLPGVREYLRGQTERANAEDIKMQLLAEYGPQNVGEAWKYFKHWVKGRPMSDAVALPPQFTDPVPGTRSDYGTSMPVRMYEYDAGGSDRQPQVYASDKNAYNAARALPYEENVPLTTEWEDDQVRKAKHLREEMQDVLEKAKSDAHNGDNEMEAREEAAEAMDVMAAAYEEKVNEAEVKLQGMRLQELTA